MHVDAELAARIRQVRFVAFDFDGVFTDNTVFVGEDGSEWVRCWRGDGIGLRKLVRLGLGSAIISSEPNPVVLVRSQKLRIHCEHGVEDKLAALEKLLSEKGLSLAQAAFVGNDVNDLACLQAVGLPVVVHNAHPDVIPCAAYRTQAPGGYGAVRELCDLFEQVWRDMKAD
jgi:3-deoxy-D-manno-octulosonate 8-phosphate phosphatase (KDO 8-P phosphatase)